MAITTISGKFLIWAWNWIDARAFARAQADLLKEAIVIDDGSHRVVINP
jgi:hypothetical protein